MAIVVIVVTVISVKWAPSSPLSSEETKVLARSHRSWLVCSLNSVASAPDGRTCRTGHPPVPPAPLPPCLRSVLSPAAAVHFIVDMYVLSLRLRAFSHQSSDDRLLNLHATAGWLTLSRTRTKFLVGG